MFADWFREKFEEWRRGRYGHEGSESSFAEFLNINQKSVNEYLNGKSVPKHNKTIKSLQKVYGNEFCMAIGIEPLTPIEKLHIDIDKLPVESHTELFEKIAELTGKYSVQNSDPQDE